MLVGNYTILNKQPGRLFGGNSTAHASGVGQSAPTTRGNWSKTGALHCVAIPSVGSTALPLISIPVGYGGEGWMMPITAGGMSSFRVVNGTGDISAANLAGGLNAEAALSGSGDIASAVGSLIVSATAALSGSGDLAADIGGIIDASAALSGSGDLTASIDAFGYMTATPSGSGDLAAVSFATGSISASINVTGDLLTSANVGDAVWSFLMSSGYSATECVDLLTAIAAGKTDITGSVVTFRDLADSRNAVVANMTDSERTTVTLTLE